METAITSIRNNDEDILDFLADLENRSPLILATRELQRDNSSRICLVDEHKKESLFTVLIVNTPLNLTENDSRLLMWAHPSLHYLIRFFRRWMENVQYDDTSTRQIIGEVLSVMYELERKITTRENLAQSSKR